MSDIIDISTDKMLIDSRATYYNSKHNGNNYYVIKIKVVDKPFTSWYNEVINKVIK
mgnify:CR=1 FL=1